MSETVTCDWCGEQVYPAPDGRCSSCQQSLAGDPATDAPAGGPPGVGVLNYFGPDLHAPLAPAPPRPASPVIGYAASVLRRPVQAAALVYWDLVRNNNGTNAAGLMFGLAGALVAAAINSAKSDFSAQVGVLALADGRVHLMKLGAKAIAGTDDMNFTLDPSIVVQSAPSKIVDFEPLYANAKGDKLDVGGAKSFTTGTVSDAISVNVIAWGAFEGDPDATALAGLITSSLKNLPPETLMQRVFAGQTDREPDIAKACADDGYMKEFFAFVRRRKRIEQRQFHAAAWAAGGALKQRLEQHLEKESKPRLTRFLLTCYISAPLLVLAFILLVAGDEKPHRTPPPLKIVAMILLVLPMSAAGSITVISLLLMPFIYLFVNRWYARQLSDLRAGVPVWQPPAAGLPAGPAATRPVGPAANPETALLQLLSTKKAVFFGEYEGRQVFSDGGFMEISFSLPPILTSIAGPARRALSEKKIRKSFPKFSPSYDHVPLRIERRGEQYVLTTRVARTCVEAVYFDYLQSRYRAAHLFVAGPQSPVIFDMDGGPQALLMPTARRS